MCAQNENVLIQLRLLNDKMTSIEPEHAELRSLYEKVGVLQSDVEYIRRDLNTVPANQERIFRIHICVAPPSRSHEVEIKSQ